MTNLSYTTLACDCTLLAVETSVTEIIICRYRKIRDDEGKWTSILNCCTNTMSAHKLCNLMAIRGPLGAAGQEEIRFFRKNLTFKHADSEQSVACVHDSLLAPDLKAIFPTINYLSTYESRP